MFTNHAENEKFGKFSEPLDRSMVPNEGKSGDKHIPGEPGVWVIILGDMVIFGMLFVVYLYYRSLDLDLFINSQAALNFHLGAVNTLVLLLSSFCVVKGVETYRRNTLYSTSPSTWLALALSCGFAFVILKIIEYREKLSEGITPLTNDFYMYYYMLTGIHLLHVFIGISVLTFMWKLSRSLERDKRNIGFLEGGASFWHMVDLLWIVLFPLLYLMR